MNLFANAEFLVGTGFPNYRFWNRRVDKRPQKPFKCRYLVVTNTSFFDAMVLSDLNDN